MFIYYASILDQPLLSADWFILHRCIQPLAEQLRFWWTVWYPLKTNKSFNRPYLLGSRIWGEWYVVYGLMVHIWCNPLLLFLSLREQSFSILQLSHRVSHGREFVAKVHSHYGRIATGWANMPWGSSSWREHVTHNFPNICHLLMLKEWIRCWYWHCEAFVEPLVRMSKVATALYVEK